MQGDLRVPTKVRAARETTTVHHPNTTIDNGTAVTASEKGTTGYPCHSKYKRAVLLVTTCIVTRHLGTRFFSCIFRFYHPRCLRRQDLSSRDVPVCSNARPLNYEHCKNSCVQAGSELTHIVLMKDPNV